MTVAPHRHLRAVRSPEVSPEAFRAALGAHPAGVVVVSGHDGSGPVGMTATSFVSISLSPPLIAFAVDTGSSTWPRLRKADSLVVHLLGDEHQELAGRFATKDIDRFAEPTRWAQLRTGEPLLTDVRTWLRCRVDEHILLGDHFLVVARVLEANVDDAHVPLVYHSRGYRRLV
jgi:flavin reductase (DIM6/NTAB) family NADH-FMN oxidoreductase RutF